METLKKIHWPGVILGLMFGALCVLPMTLTTINHGFEAVGPGIFAVAFTGLAAAAVIVWASVLDD